ncbi:MAG: glycosyltransferase family 2 protein [Oscillospiraceae bacterium]|jgi:glycosyltransferase involved in cell wall biosynthesis|nr:glycosyltransferase family 2 protein [Oscillospiraceae bacterium]
MKNTLYIVIPCYNEEAALPPTSEVMLGKLRQLVSEGKASGRSRVLLVDDGSRDATWKIIAGLCEKYTEFAGVKLSRNRGTQNAIMAGLDTAREFADMVITTDADLQDDIGAVDRMVDEYLAGADVVYGVRSKRETDTFFKRFSAQAYYKLLTWLECGTVYNHSDFRLLSRRALDALDEYGERDMFIRGVVPLLGFKTAVVEYERGARNAGETKYTVKSLYRLAATGVTSMSTKPLRLIKTLGFLMILAAVALLIFAPYSRLVLASVWVVGGLVTCALGIVGEYVGRTFTETKRRPRYHIEQTVQLKETDEER